LLGEISGSRGNESIINVLMMEAVSASETSVNFYETIQRNIPEFSHFFIVVIVAAAVAFTLACGPPKYTKVQDMAVPSIQTKAGISNSMKQSS
jgi:hypothetical protein